MALPIVALAARAAPAASKSGAGAAMKEAGGQFAREAGTQAVEGLAEGILAKVREAGRPAVDSGVKHCGNAVEGASVAISGMPDAREQSQNQDRGR